MNIWENFNFKERTGTSAYDLLVAQNNSFVAKTGGLLSLVVESVNSSNNEYLIYKLYVVANTLGGYRKHILDVKEDDRTNYFPVYISSSLTDKSMSFVTAMDFLTKIEEMLTYPTIKRTIENLYQQANENK